MASHRYLHRAVPAWVRFLLCALALLAALYAVLLVGGGSAVGLSLDPGHPLPHGLDVFGFSIELDRRG